MYIIYMYIYVYFIYIMYYIKLNIKFYVLYIYNIYNIYNTVSELREPIKYLLHNTGSLWLAQSSSNDIPEFLYGHPVR